MLLVIGATPEGIDFPELKIGAEAFARAGFLVMIPDLPFMKEERLDPTGPAQLADAFAALRAHTAARPPVGAFGFSIGGGVLLAGAAREPELAKADYLAVLGAYFDMDTYIASVASRSQRRDGESAPWTPSPDVPERLAKAASKLAADEAERTEILRVLAAETYDDALARVRALPSALRASLDALSPRPRWERITSPIFWLHDERDLYVPIAEADAARRQPPRTAPLRMTTPRVLQHAVPVADAARGQSLLFWIRELWKLLDFAMAVLRAAG
jgi:pimeloyl-ACP methyl ester carboxylesterase